MATQYFENYYTAYLSEVVSFTDNRGKIREMRFGTALSALSEIKKPYKNVLGIKVEEFAQIILKQNIPEEFEELKVGLVTLVGQFTNNKKLIQMGEEIAEAVSDCSAYDIIEYKYHLDILIPNLQLQPSLFESELKMLEAA